MATAPVVRKATLAALSTVVSEQKGAEEKLALLEQARDQHKESFQALSSEAFQKTMSILNLARPRLISIRRAQRATWINARSY